MTATEDHVGSAHAPAGEPLRTAPRDLPQRSAGEDIVHAVRRHWPLVILVALALTLLSWIVAATQPKRYRAQSVAAVAPLVSGNSTSDVLRSVDSLDRRVVISTVAALASTTTTLAEAGALTDDKVEAAVLPMTSLLSISVEGHDPRHVAMLANSIPRSLDKQTRAMFVVYEVTMASTADVPTKPSLPRVERAMMVGLVLGLLAGVAAAYLIDLRRRTAP